MEDKDFGLILGDASGPTSTVYDLGGMSGQHAVNTQLEQGQAGLVESDPALACVWGRSFWFSSGGSLSKAADWLAGVSEVRRDERSISEMIAFIQAMLSLNVTEISEVMRVKRPTVYAWLDESAVPLPHNETRIVKIFNLAKQWAERSDLPVGALVRRRIEGGPSLVELLARAEIHDAPVVARFQEFSLVVKRMAKQARGVRGQLEARGLDSKKYEVKGDALGWITGKRLSPESEE